MREMGEKAKNDWIRESTGGKRKSRTIIAMMRGEIGRFNELRLTAESRQARQPQSGQGDGAWFGRGDNRNRCDVNLEETVRLIAAAQKAGTREGGIQIRTASTAGIVHSIAATATGVPAAAAAALPTAAATTAKAAGRRLATDSISTTNATQEREGTPATAAGAART
jgi:hypothetical protein